MFRSRNWGSRKATRPWRRKSAEGIVGHAVGEASEALQAERRSNG